MATTNGVGLDGDTDRRADDSNRPPGDHKTESQRKLLNGHSSNNTRNAEDVDLESTPFDSYGRGLRNPSTYETNFRDDDAGFSQIPNVVKSRGELLNGNKLPLKKLHRETTFNDGDNSKNEITNANSSVETKSTKSLPTQEQTKVKTSETLSLKSLIKSKMKQIQNQKASSNSLRSVPPPVHKESLSVPSAGGSDVQKTDGMPGSRRESNASSRLSPLTTPRHVNARVQYTSLQMTTEDKRSIVSPENTWMRVAIPFLPLWTAVICLLLNILLPGTGTILSGFCILCCGKSRVPPKYDQDIIVLVCVNAWVGVAQLFTVTFLLVGWFWSLAWGIKMVLLAIEYKKELAEERAKELQKMAITAFGDAMYNRSRF